MIVFAPLHRQGHPMRTFTRASMLLAVSLLVISQFYRELPAQSDTRGSGARSGSGSQDDQQQGSGERQRPRSPEEFHEALWQFLTTGNSDYHRWDTLPGSPKDMYAGDSPHGAYLQLYANSVARGNAEELPHGSVLVVENYDDDQQTLLEITVMYRSEDYDTDHNDWYWIKYLPDGSVATTPPEDGSQPIAGRHSSCIECHAGADGEDYSFANDES